jgi:hypothetical protein
VQNLSPRAVRLYLMRLDDLWALLFPASLPSASGLPASSCSYGRDFVSRFFQLHLAATPCGSLRLPSSAPVGSFHPTRFCPCRAHWGSQSWLQPPFRRLWRRDIFWYQLLVSTHSIQVSQACSSSPPDCRLNCKARAIAAAANIAAICCKRKMRVRRSALRAESLLSTASFAANAAWLQFAVDGCHLSPSESR